MGSKQIIAQLQAKAKNLGCPQQPCPGCKSEKGFRQHDCRCRQVLAIVVRFVVPFVICLKRWKCVWCGVTFTHYPEFLVPYKRYVLSTVLAMSERYVTEPRACYRKVVTPEGVAVGYAERKDGTIDERQLSHSTLWHWLTWLGSLSAFADQGVDLLRQKDPCFDLHRAATPIAPWKYRSAKRRVVLEQAAFVLRAGAEFVRHFSRWIFPTLCNSAPSPP